MYLTSIVITRIGVELVEVQGNYPTQLRYDSNSTRLGLSI